MPSVLEIILYVLIGVGATIWIISSIYEMKTGKKLLKKKKKDKEEDD